MADSTSVLMAESPPIPRTASGKRQSASALQRNREYFDWLHKQPTYSCEGDECLDDSWASFIADSRYERERVRLQQVAAKRRQKPPASEDPAYALWVDDRRRAYRDGRCLLGPLTPAFWRMHMAQQKERARQHKRREARRAAQLAAGIQVPRPPGRPPGRSEAVARAALRERQRREKAPPLPAPASAPPYLAPCRILSTPLNHCLCHLLPPFHAFDF